MTLLLFAEIALVELALALVTLAAVRTWRRAGGRGLLAFGGLVMLTMEGVVTVAGGAPAPFARGAALLLVILIALERADRARERPPARP